MQPETNLQALDSLLTPAGAAAIAGPAADGRKGRWRIVSALRYQEVCLLQGAPFMGLLFSLGRPYPPKAPSLALFVPASFLLVAHIWSLNDWADIRTDRCDPNKRDAARRAGVGRSRDLLVFSLLLLAVSLALFALLPPRTMEVALVIAALGALYSLPLFRLKGVPLASSMVHFMGGLFHFLLGYSLYTPINRKGILLAVFFALIFTAGHAIQEVQDWEADRRSRIRTTAVHFGRGPVFFAAVSGFVTALIVLFLLARFSIVASWLGLFVPFSNPTAALLVHAGAPRRPRVPANGAPATPLSNPIRRPRRPNGRVDCELSRDRNPHLVEAPYLTRCGSSSESTLL